MCAGVQQDSIVRTCDTSLDKDWGKRPGSGSKLSRDLPVDSKNLVIRQPIKTKGVGKNKSKKKKKKNKGSMGQHLKKKVTKSVLV